MATAICNPKEIPVSNTTIPTPTMDVKMVVGMLIANAMRTSATARLLSCIFSPILNVEPYLINSIMISWFFAQSVQVP